MTIMYEAKLINTIPPEADLTAIKNAVGTIRKVLQTRDIGVTEVLTLVKQALFDSSPNISATMVALLKALPTVKTAPGLVGFT